MKIRLHAGYVVAAVGYMVGIFVLSELPAWTGGGRVEPMPELVLNLLHIPLFAGLASCLLMGLSGGRWNRTVSPQLYGVVGILAGVFATFDEWHQSFVVGRFVSVGDFLLDCVGIAGLLLLHRLLRGGRATARVSSTLSAPAPTASRRPT